MEISIGELSRRAGVKVPTIRTTRVPASCRRRFEARAKQRRYAVGDVSRLNFIRHARDLEFEVDAIRELLTLSAEPDRSCAGVDGIARRHLAAIKRRIGHLVALEGELQRMVEACGHGRVGDCRVIETLGDHGRAQHDQGSAERFA